MRPGDLLLFHRSINKANWKADPKGTFFCWLIHLTTRSRWNHAAIAVTPNAYVEATAAGVLRTLTGTNSDDVMTVPVTYKDDMDDRNAAVAWALSREGERYGYLNAILCGVNNVLVGLHLVIKNDRSLICSELVAEAMERGNIDFGKDSALVSPGDLATHFGVTR